MSASACIDNVGVLPENFIDCTLPYASSGWLSPRISFSRDLADDRGRNDDGKADLERSGKDFVEFEFRLDDTVKMLTADELFSDGKLIPLQLAPTRPAKRSPADVRSPVPISLWRRVEINGPDLYAFSPKAPRCSSRWKELLGLKKAQSSKPERQNTSPTTSKGSNGKSLKLFLHRNPKSSSSDSSLNLPLLRDSDSESASISARVSLSSSSSSGADPEDLPRLSLDSEKINPAPISLCHNPPRYRVANTRSLKIRRPPALPAEGNKTVRVPESATDGPMAVRVGRSTIRPSREPGDRPSPRGSSVDSPRLNASGKVIFQGLERSSSSPSTFNGGFRPRPRGMERSYSTNVMVTPVLNVPVCTLRGSAKSISVFDFGQLFAPQKKEKEGSSAAKNGFAKTKCEKAVPRN
uniref:Protein TPRXL n=1 Tax=Dendrobium officinale TaxID=142615 RepID=A0A1J0CN44_DENOF|nr:protein TPRXL [Dendrobium officinale]